VLQLLKRITLLNAAALTVLTFFLMSVVGGGLLWITEKDRTVVAKTPYTTSVSVNPETDQNPATKEFSNRETHTFVREISYQGERFIDTWFTAVSALCVTGLTSTDFSSFTPAGQVVVMVLIQMGGLGIIVFTSILAFAVFRGLTERMSIRKLLGSVMDSDHSDVTDMLKYVFAYTIVFELAGTLIMGAYLQWFADPALINGMNPWWWALFHSVSAFNNAGFGLLNNNLVNFVTDPVINLTISVLIILGGLGYPVLIAIYLWVRSRVKVLRNQKVQAELKQDLSGVASLVQIRVALIGTVLLLAIGTLIPFLTEMSNPVNANYSLPQQFMISFFQSVSTRTAGFNTIDVGALHISTLFLYILLMFIGANPAGTAGGIKIPTVAVLYGYIKDWFDKPGQPVVLLGRSISKFAVSHAIRLFFFSTLFIAAVTFIITTIESGYLLTPDSMFNFQKVLFEIVSAFGTVGMSMSYAGGVTSFSGILSDPSKLLIMLTMLFGRIGPLVILQSLPRQSANGVQALSPDFEGSDRIQIG
jgi:trk system potassium uptake protein TrkH